MRGGGRGKGTLLKIYTVYVVKYLSSQYTRHTQLIFEDDKLSILKDKKK
jgi:hypothetical protein